jgi:hypothetical protein
MSEFAGTRSPRLARPLRIALILAGLLLVAISGPIAFVFAVIAGGGHGSPFDDGAAAFAMGITLLAVPLLIAVLGIICIVCTTRLRLRIAGGIAVSIPIVLASAIVLGHIAS